MNAAQHSIHDLTADSSIDPGVLVAYPNERPATQEFSLGTGARLRSGTILYDGASIGVGFATGHNVVVREDVTIGDHVSIWTNSIVDYGVTIGDRVKIHSQCYIAQFTVIEDDVFLAPGVTIANDLYPGSKRSAEIMAGPVIRAGVQIGVNSTVLPYVEIGEGALIGAGSVVTGDVPPGVVVYGNPARVTKRVTDLTPIDDRPEVRTAVATRRLG